MLDFCFFVINVLSFLHFAAAILSISIYTAKVAVGNDLLQCQKLVEITVNRVLLLLRFLLLPLLPQLSSHNIHCGLLWWWLFVLLLLLFMTDQTSYFQRSTVTICLLFIFISLIIFAIKQKSNNIVKKENCVIIKCYGRSKNIY